MTRKCRLAHKKIMLHIQLFCIIIWSFMLMCSQKLNSQNSILRTQFSELNSQNSTLDWLISEFKYRFSHKHVQFSELNNWVYWFNYSAYENKCWCVLRIIHVFLAGQRLAGGRLLSRVSVFIIIYYHLFIIILHFIYQYLYISGGLNKKTVDLQTVLVRFQEFGMENADIRGRFYIFLLTSSRRIQQNATASCPFDSHFYDFSREPFWSLEEFAFAISIENSRKNENKWLV